MTTSTTSTADLAPRGRQVRAALPMIALGVALPAIIFGLLAWQMTCSTNEG